MDRPSGLLSRLDNDEYDAFNDTDFAEVLDGMACHSGSLCVECSDINFAAIFDFMKPTSQMTINLNSATRKSDSCVFCCAVATAASKRPALLEAMRDQDIECEVRSWHSRNYGLEKDRHLYYPYLTLAVFIKSSTNPDDVPWFPEHLRKQRIRHTQTCLNEDLECLADDPLLVLERIGPEDLHVQQPTRNSGVTDDGLGADDSDSDESDFEAEYQRNLAAEWKFRRIRKLLGSSINVGFFRNAIEKFHQAPAHMEPADLSLSQLIETSRMRLINVHTGNVEIIRKPERYVALSYVWGGSSHHSSSVSYPNSALHNEVTWSIDWDYVPKTIKDARDLLRQLGEDYLWVDTLCINQSDLEDKRAIIPKMTTIYGCASMTLVAAAGKDAHFGLPGVSEGTRKPDVRLSFTSFGSEVILTAKRPETSSIIHRSTWYSRAWTCQEWLLSPNLMYITEVEAWLLNGSTICRERARDRKIPSTQAMVIPEGKSRALENRDSKITAHEVLSRPGLASWTSFGDALVMYTQRNLTYPGDRLGAFLGILNRFSDQSITLAEQKVLSGLPYQWFYACLLWEPGDRGQKPVRIPFDDVRQQALPTWSWAGWNGSATLHESKLGPQHDAVKVRVLDHANVVCDSFSFGNRNHWPCEPPPEAVDPCEGVVLHLWTTKVDLHLKHYRGRAYWLEHRGKDLSQAVRLGTMWIDQYSGAKYCNEESQPFILLGGCVLLVEKFDRFYERRGLGYLSWSRKLPGNPRSPVTEKWVRELGVLEHIKLR